MDKICAKIKDLIKFLGAVLLGLFIIGLIYFGIDFILKDALPYISRSVLSNFIMFVIIISWVVKRQVHPVKMLEDAQKIVVDSIMESESVKVKSEERLSSIEESMASIEDEIDSILEKSKENATLVGEKVLQDGRKTALIIQENVDKTLVNNRTALKNELLKRASLASVEVAKNHILNELNNNSDLHDKLIDESIDVIEGIG